MNDTCALVSELVGKHHDSMTPAERWHVASAMFESARTIVESSLTGDLTVQQRRLAVARRLYGGELPDAALTAHAKFDSAPWHAHVYYAAAERGRAEAFRGRLVTLRESGKTPQLLFVGDLRDGKMGPHTVPQFEVHFTAALVAMIEGFIRDSGLTALVHPLTHDDLADHTHLGRWIGAPINLDLSVLDPPGINQGFARFGKTDFL